MALLPPENHEQILIRSSVRDVIRCKSVCKSWLTLISESWFIKAHLNHSYLSDRYNKEIGDRRVIMSIFRFYFLHHPYNFHKFFDFSDRNLLGSSHGLVCVSRPTLVLVVNPSTREVKRIKKPQFSDFESLRWGFGYNSSMDDYKVVLGFKKDQILTCFQVFSLRSNIWKVIGEVDHVFLSSIGVLFNEALHWVAYNTSKKKSAILSFHLRTEKFLEVPLPDKLADHLYIDQHLSTRLGIVENCLCLFQDEFLFNEIWVMKDYNKKHSWEISGPEYESRYHTVHNMKSLKNFIPNRNVCHETLLCQSPWLAGAPLYVESLVSPHFRKRKKRARTTMMSPKVKLNVNDNASTSYRA